jgi:hypothetical protein
VIFIIPEELKMKNLESGEKKIITFCYSVSKITKKRSYIHESQRERMTFEWAEKMFVITKQKKERAFSPQKILKNKISNNNKVRLNNTLWRVEFIFGHIFILFKFSSQCDVYVPS